MRQRPIPGAPLPPAVFEGTRGERLEQSAYGGEEGVAAESHAPRQLPLPEVPPVLIFLVPLLVGALLLAITGNLALAVLAGVVVALGMGIAGRR